MNFGYNLLNETFPESDNSGQIHQYTDSPEKGIKKGSYDDKNSSHHIVERL